MDLHLISLEEVANKSRCCIESMLYADGILCDAKSLNKPKTILRINRTSDSAYYRFYIHNTITICDNKLSGYMLFILGISSSTSVITYDDGFCYGGVSFLNKLSSVISLPKPEDELEFCGKMFAIFKYVIEAEIEADLFACTMLDTPTKSSNSI